jgi:hypothetical protein
MRRRKPSLPAALVALLAGVLALGAAGLRSPAPLRFSPGGRFRLALFADLHYGENAWTDWGPAQDDGSDHVMDAVLDAEKPGNPDAADGPFSEIFLFFSLKNFPSPSLN